MPRRPRLGSSHYEVLDSRGVAELTVETDETRDAKIRPEALTQNADDRRADLADEVLGEVAEDDRLRRCGDCRNVVVDLVAVAKQRARFARLNVAHSARGSCSGRPSACG
ncbi:p006 [Rhizobium phage 16-3]|uniref:p006 n=1 Tax=Rhizobium phage 16-3 TaxID=10704 RepID=UPI00017BA589|nr:p006 [Rhizobium phage 16-3]ABF71258.1 p006 [Rhizobium phage 16-3]